MAGHDLPEARLSPPCVWHHSWTEGGPRAPEVVVPGHMTPQAPQGLAAVKFTKAYLLAIEEELAKADTSKALAAAMTARYPNLGMGVALAIGAKVLTGEMKWG